ncbi:MAG TPA: PAS domain-containing protein, partial [Allocoleopsis sp.]
MDRIALEDLESVILPLFSEIYTVQTLHTTSYEYRFHHKDGTLRWISSRFMVKRDESNHCWVLNQLALDITESKRAEAERNRAEAALRQSETTLRRAQQVAHVGSWQVDIQTGKVTWTEESFHIMGWDMTQPEPDLSQFYDLIHPDDRDLLRQQVENVIAHQSAYKVEFRVLHPDGSLHCVEARGEVIVNEEGQVTHLIGTNLDITERKQAEEALRYSEATKNQILKAIPDLIIWMNTEGMCLDLIDGNTV